jgi:hypothetical protein
VRVVVRVVLPVTLAAALLAACAAPLQPETAADKTSPPKLGACYRLSPEDTREPSNASEPVPCTAPHTAETFAIGTLPESTGEDYDSPDHGQWIFRRCGRAFERFLSADESLTMRIQLSWAWFRPSERGWDKGARWYRCDLVGGPDDTTKYRDLPRTAKGLFRARPPEEWLTCARGATVMDSTKVPCSEQHDWRAVTTIKLGTPEDRYPGDRMVEVRSRDYCSDSVGAWMNYPVDYEFGYTWFREAEWQAGNRRSICWAKTDR